MPPPDVTIIGPYPSGDRRGSGQSGVAWYTANLARALLDIGLDVAVVAQRVADAPDEIVDDGLRVHRAYTPGPRALVDAARAARAMDPAVVHLQWETFLYGGPSALTTLVPALLLLRRRPTVTTLHQVVDPAEIDDDFMQLHRVNAPAVAARVGLGGLQKTIARLSTATIVHERAFQPIVRGSTHIPHGVHRAAAPDRATARAALGLDERFTVLCFGFVAPYKGLESALAAAEVCGGEINFVVAGGDHPRLRRLGYSEQLRARYGSIATFAGWVEDKDVGNWFAAADLALFPYPRPFSSSGAFADALAYGTPVLVSDALAACMDVPTELSTSCAPPQLARRLLALAADPARLDAVATTVSSMVAERTWDAIAVDHARLYKEIA